MDNMLPQRKFAYRGLVITTELTDTPISPRGLTPIR